MKEYNNVDIIDWLERQMRNKESYDVEFKSAAGGFPASFWETYSSFANTDGGTIVLGIKEKDGLFVIDNLTAEQIEKHEKTFWCSVNSREKVNHNLLTNDDVRQVEFDGHNILLFYIPRAPRELRPIHCTLNPDNGTYKRNNEGDFKCTPLEVRRMFADANVNTPADSRILDNYSFDDIDRPSLEQYRRLFDLAKPGHAWLGLDELSLLKKLGGYRIDRKTGKEGFTVAGMLMFGKSDAITDEECVPFFFPDYRELPEFTNAGDRWTDRICPDGTWEANLFQFYRRVLVKLQEGLPKPFRLDNDMRIDETPAHIAIREALINCCLHADYSINAPIVITKSMDKIEFSNPGNLLVSKQQYYEGGISVCRNTSLQKMFMMLGRAEKAGSGADTIISGWKAANKVLPDIREDVRPDKVTLILPMASFIDDNTKKELECYFGHNILNIEHEKLLVLSLALQEGYISNERLRYSLNMHRYDITQMLRSMREEGLLTSYGTGRGTLYKLPASISRDNTSISRDNTSISKDNTSISKDNTSISKDNTSAPSKRYRKEDLYNIITDVSKDWMTAGEISVRIGRDLQYIKGKVIPQMLKMHLIERKYPNIPNHPAQKYRCIEDETIE